MYTKKILIRPAVESDTEIIASIYVVAKEFMKKTGNPKQWEDILDVLAVLQHNAVLNVD